MKDQNPIESFDNLFKQSFEGVKTPAPEGLWEGIASSTTGAATSGTGILAKIFGIKGVAILTTVVVITATLTTLYLTQVDSPSEPESTKTLTQTEQTGDFDASQDDPQPHIQNSGVEESTAVESKANEPTTQIKETGTDENRLPQVSPADGNPTIPNEVNPPIQLSEDPKITVPAELMLHASTDKLCINQEVFIRASANASILAIRWYLNNTFINEGKQDLVVILTKSGINTVRARVTFEDGSAAEKSKTMIVEKMNAGFSHQITDETLSLSAENGSASHAWFVNNVKLASGSASVTSSVPNASEVKVIHIASNLRGCLDTVIQTISIVNCDFEPIFYDIFSPDLQDGLNDDWVIEMPVVDSYYLIIYSRDGREAFQTRDQKVNWNGRRFNQGEMMPRGTYTYHLVYECGGISKVSGGIFVMN